MNNNRKMKQKNLYVTMKRVSSTSNSLILREKNTEKNHKQNAVNNSTENDNTISVISKP
jgi:hypothetical protein